MSHRNTSDDRHRLAAEAARLMIDLSLPTVAAARRKLIEKTGQRDPRQLPDDQEIAAAVRDYRLLFGGQPSPDGQSEAREAALEAMRALAAFKPRLVDPVAGVATDPLAAIWLLTYADEPEALIRFLDELGVPLRQRSRKLDLGKREPVHTPLLTFSVRRPPIGPLGPVDLAFEVSVLPLDAQRVRARLPGDTQALKTVGVAELVKQIAGSR